MRAWQLEPQVVLPLESHTDTETAVIRGDVRGV